MSVRYGALPSLAANAPLATTLNALCVRYLVSPSDKAIALADAFECGAFALLEALSYACPMAFLLGVHCLLLYIPTHTEGTRAGMYAAAVCAGAVDTVCERYGARLTGIYTRGCYWFPHLLA
jgi:hypothetical protein